MMSAAVAAKTGLQRAAIHSNNGKIETMATSSHGMCGANRKSELAPASSARAAPPSAVSLSDGGSCRAALKPITKGATVMTPMTSDANQWYQMISGGVFDL